MYYLVIILASMSVLIALKAVRMFYSRRIRKVKVDDIIIAYRQYGSGIPLILISGYGSKMTVWRRSFLSSLYSKYKVIIFDNRGMGLTTLGEKEYTLQQCAQDTKGLLDALGIKKAYVLGYSMGASIAQEFILKYPHAVKKLILGGSNALGKAQMDTRVQRSLADLSGSNSVLWKRRLRLIFPREWLDSHSYLMNIKVTFNRFVMKKQVEAMQKWKGTNERLKEIKVPTLLFVGKKDVITPPENAIFIAQQIEGAWLVQLEKAGHGIINQEPYKVAQLLKLFLSD
jgi:pimeloyl-ACP methyl ester carboxylesterase